jgi:DNA-binding HxlR family transcriptional regulator
MSMARTVGNCQAFSLIHLLGKRWTIPIVELFEPTRHSEMHFNEIQSRLTNITPRILSASLEELCDAKIIEKSERDFGYRGYYLTKHGIALQNFIQTGKELGVDIYGIDSRCLSRKCAECESFRRY